jgi:hypothetical protein
MIQRKEKYETPQFVFWLTEYSEDSHYPYDLILASTNVAPHLNREELQGLANFINNFLKETT